MSPRATSGGLAAREAVLRWSLRMFRREWRQQILITLLVAAAVAATILGAGLISGSQVPQNAGYGSANTLVTLSGNDPHLALELRVLQQHFGPLGVIESVPVSTGTVQGTVLESLDPHGPYVEPTVQLASGRYPAARDEVDLTSELAQLYGTHVGGTWVADGTTWRVVGEVRTPTDLNATFALAAPGAIAHPATVTALFDATQEQLATFSPPRAVYNTLVGSINPKPGSPGLDIGEILLLIAATFGMLFIGLIAVAGFTVLARRRTRAIGMLGALGADESLVRLALLVNGLVVGLASMVLGGAVGLVGWWLYAPHQQASVGHVVDPAAIPWWLVVVALLLAPITTTLAARRPARATARLPVVAALSGRPTEPKASRRNAAVGAGILAGGVLIVFAGGAAGHGGDGSGNGAGVLSVLLGIVLASVGLFMVAQWIVAQLGRLAARAPVAAKVALRDLARYRSRSGAALGAICLALLVTGVVVVAATARYSDPFDYVGPNLTSNVVMVYPNEGGGPGGVSIQCTPDGGCVKGGSPQPTMTDAQFTAFAKRLATAIGASSTLPLYLPNAGINRTTGRNFDGPVFVATPALLAHYGIAPSSINPDAMVLTSRPGLTDYASSLALVYGQAWSNPGFFNGNVGPCPPGYCVPGPTMQYVAQLPTGTSAPNTVLTMHAVRTLHLTLSLAQYLVTTPQDLSALQKQTARTMASTTTAAVETANSFASLGEVLTWSIGLGLLLALGVLAMTVGLIRAETASELRVLTAAGASRRTRRTLTAVTAGSLGFVGALLGVVTAYLLVGAFLATSASDNLYELTENVPFRPLGIMVLGLPIIAGLGGLVFAGREPTGIAHQPIE